VVGHMPSHFAHHQCNRTDMQYCRLWQKLIFYYYADHYVNFKDLVNDLYKVGLWISAVWLPPRPTRSTIGASNDSLFAPVAVVRLSAQKHCRCQGCCRSASPCVAKSASRCSDLVWCR
jgi:hypothetical protein